MKTILRFLFIVLLVFLFIKSNAQSCSTCTLHVSGVDSSSYTINTGQSLCIDSSGVFYGTITINGGLVCNNGIFNPSTINFVGGTVSNNSNASFSAAITFSTNALINNSSTGILNFNNGITMSGGALTNNGILNVNQNITNSSGSITNTSIINCETMSGAGSLTNSGIINSN